MRAARWAASCAALLAATTLAGRAPAQDRLILGLPVDCILGETCHIQQYTDRDPGPGVRDFMCNGLTYDGHKGTDFALPSRAAMRAGVAVLAAAPGRVRGVRNAMEDRAYTPDMAAALGGRNCGNGVVIDHGGGWETQYCHMRKGSVTVRPGDRVKRGDRLGLVGLSGRTQFPHAHLSVRHAGRVVDPFAPDGPVACDGAQPSDTLWQDTPAYAPGGIIAAGIATTVPSFEEIKDGVAHAATLDSDAPALVGWGYAFGGRAGDVVRLSLMGARGEIVTHDATLDKAQAQFFRAAGRRARGRGWGPGRIVLRVTLIRDGEEIDSAEASARIE
ncbi:M23 family metallopeptidase [Roseovarius spongiae]|uniref:M23 family metallopeptidase n=1 Tax=Roseovarius spongiae TaxID=2320272 RepID=A0A3A8ATD8_9RHOB|nr:M23 family metallopeptidase [Roseovarius spongiae]RKF13870.1 M23 family metallopeptidase [Roseovarius spongiae]